MNTSNCACNCKSWIIQSLIIALVFFGVDFVIQHKILMPDWMAMIDRWRPVPEMESKRWVAFGMYLLFGFLFTAIFAKGYEPAKPRQIQGIRFGAVMGLFYWGCQLLGMYPFEPWPDVLYFKVFAFGMAEFLLLGVLVGAMYRPKS